MLAAATDDAWLVERAGGSVVVVPSTPANFKVTTPHDLRVAELLLEAIDVVGYSGLRLSVSSLAAQSVQRVTRIAMTGPPAGVSRYCG